MNDVVLKHRDAENNRHYDCPMCGADMKVRGNVFYGQCPTCKMTLIDYKPAPYQEKFHQSKAQYRLNIGGFGSGKTTMCCAELAEHVLSVPNGKSLITAPKLQQVRDAVIPELDKFLPTYLIEKKVSSPNIYYLMKNGHEILVYASNDEENLRSLNLTAFYIEEASNVDFTVFTQLQARLRNTAAVLRNEQGDEVDYAFMGLVSTNPDDGWVRTEFLLRSGKIFTSSSLDRNVYDKIRQTQRENEYHAFLSSSRDNPYLPKRFISTLCIGKSVAWIRKYIDCYLDIKEGAVYPEFTNCLVPRKPVNPHYEIMSAYDPGFRDPTAYLIGYIDPIEAVIYIYEEYYVRDKPISVHAAHFKQSVKDKKMYMLPQADPSVLKRNDRDMESYQRYFQSLTGIYLQPAGNDIMAGIEKVRDYMYTGKLKIYNDLDNIKDEASKYVYMEKKETPNEKDNHLMDCLRYLVMALPTNPLDFNQTLFQKAEAKNFWAKDWQHEEEGVFHAGGVYLTQGGLLDE